MTSGVRFPVAETVVITWLAGQLDPVRVVSQVPSPRPGELVKVTRVGGPQRDLRTDSPLVLVECWAATRVRAGELAADARAAAHAMRSQRVGDVWVKDVVDVAGPSFFPDPDTTSPRYQFTVQPYLRGARYQIRSTP